MSADLFELYGWDLHSGILHNRAPLYVEELRQVANAVKFDRQATASKAGVLLEQLLDVLALRYECRVPHRRDSAYTLGELADAISGNKKVAKLLEAEQLNGDGISSRVPLTPLIVACAEFTWVRNQVGAHFNVNAASVPDAMVREFGQRVLALADALLCRDCGRLPDKDKTGQYLQCGGGCGHARLYPLRTPAN